MPQRPFVRRARVAFTLIELLVVIAVVGLLVSLMLPALFGAVQRARAVSCQSRLRQVSLGWAIYADEYRGAIVPGQPGRFADESRNLYDVGNGLQYRPRWYALMGVAAGFYAYANPSADRDDEHSTLITNPVFTCTLAADWTSARNTGYGYNYQFLGNTRFKGDDESRGPINFPVRIERVDASRTIMAADSLGTAAGKPEALRTPNRTDGSRDPDLRARGGHGYAIDPPRLTDSSDFADSRFSAPEHRSAPEERHLGKAAVIFCDTHAAMMSLQEMGYIKNADASVAFTGPEASNALWSGSSRDDDPPRVD